MEKFIEERFNYHAADGAQVAKMEKFRGEFKNLAYLIINNVPDSREASIALRKLEEAQFYTNAAIVRNSADRI